jgi:C4-dicarboxylate transporter DctQ subunit
MSLRDRLHAVAAAARRVEEVVLGALLAAMVLLAALQIVLRNAFKTGLSWAEPFLGFAMLWLTLLGALAATGRHKHITVDLVSHWAPPLARRVLRALTDAFAGAVCVGLCAASVRFVQLQRELGSASASLGIAEWKLYVVLPAGFALMALRFGVQAVAGALGGAKPAAGEPAGATP